MANLNKVMMIGNLTREPELRYLPSGSACCNFGLAVNRNYKDKNGEQKQDVCFIDIVAWNKTAELCGEYLHKGRPVFVEGRLSLNTWETPEGDKRSKHELILEQVQFLGSKSSQQEDEDPDPDDDMPF